MSGLSRTSRVRLKADTTYVYVVAQSSLGGFPLNAAAYVVSGFSRTSRVRLKADTTYVVAIIAGRLATQGRDGKL